MSTIKLKRSAVSGKVPTTGDLDLGEIALNTYDGKAYMKKNDGTEAIVEIGGGGGAGFSATNNFVSAEDFLGDGSTTNFSVARVPYDENHVLVYINGVHQATDTYILTGNTVILDSAPANNDSVEIRTFNSVSFTTEYPYTTNNATINTSNSDIVDSFSKTEYRTAKYLVQMSHLTDFHSTEVMVMHDDTNVYLTQYAKLTSNTDLGVIDATISGNTVHLSVTPTSANTNVKTIRLLIGS